MYSKQALKTSHETFVDEITVRAAAHRKYCDFIDQNNHLLARLSPQL